MKDGHDPFRIHAFVDGELDLSSQLAMEQAMAQDPVLRSRIEEVRALRGVIRTTGEYHDVPDGLRIRLRAMTTAGGVEAQASPARPATWPRAARRPPDSARDSWSRWWGWRPLSAAFVATVALTFGTQIYVVHDRRQTGLVNEVVSSHVRSTLGDHLIDVASSDHHTVKPWLSSKLDFSPPVRDTQLGSAVFLGGRVDYVDGRPVAALVYRQGQHVVDSFVWPGAGSDSAVTYASARGYQIAYWTRDNMQHWTISDVNRAEFLELVNHLSSPPDTPAQGR